MHPLDNVIWTALTTEQAYLALGNRLARRFPDEIGPLTGLEEPSREALCSLADLLRPGEAAALFLAQPLEPVPPLQVIAAAALLQMVQSAPADSGQPPWPAGQCIPLGSDDVPQMLALTRRTQPGPFGTRTYELGSYVGIRHSGSLVAMAGERLQVPGYSEVSAVCTHPDYVGRGYARRVMQTVIEGIRARRRIPFLHVRSDNHRALSLYEKLGFCTRATLQVQVVKKA